MHVRPVPVTARSAPPSPTAWARSSWSPTTVRLIAILIGVLLLALVVTAILSGVSALALHVSRDDAGFAISRTATTATGTRSSMPVVPTMRVDGP